MKKIISIALTLCMVLGLCSFSVAAAPEGTAITDAAGFAAMDPAGTYYLANDITLTASYATAFAGTLDGNGKTVTVSAPIFTEIAGATIKNLKVAGAIDGAGADAAAVAVKATGAAVVLENIVSEVTITNAAIAGAIVANIAGVPSITVTGCVNKGDITSTGMTGGIIGKANCDDADGAKSSVALIKDCDNYGVITSGNYGAGIVASIQYTLNSAVTNCENHGAINGAHDSGGIVGHTTQAIMKIAYCENFGAVTVNTKQYAGGMVGYAWGTKQAGYTAENLDYTNVIEYNINHAAITSGYRTGGIVGSFGATDSRGIWLCQYNINLGKVTNLGQGTKGSHNCAGGIVGYAYASGTTTCAYILNNINVGDVVSEGTSVGIASYFLGYINSKGISKISGNIGLGTLTAIPGGAIALGWNEGAECEFLDCSGNSIPAGCTYPLTRELGATDKVYEVGTADLATLATGAAVYAINQAAGKDVFFMTINGTEFAPTLLAADDGSNAVVKNNDGTFANPEKAPETNAPETTEPGTSTPTGDSAIVFAVIAAVAVLGVAVVAKKREN